MGNEHAPAAQPKVSPNNSAPAHDDSHDHDDGAETFDAIWSAQASRGKPKKSTFQPLPADQLRGAQARVNQRGAARGNSTSALNVRLRQAARRLLEAATGVKEFTKQHTKDKVALREKLESDQGISFLGDTFTKIVTVALADVRVEELAKIAPGVDLESKPPVGLGELGFAFRELEQELATARTELGISSIDEDKAAVIASSKVVQSIQNAIRPGSPAPIQEVAARDRTPSKSLQGEAVKTSLIAGFDCVRALRMEMSASVKKPGDARSVAATALIHLRYVAGLDLSKRDKVHGKAVEKLDLELQALKDDLGKSSMQSEFKSESVTIVQLAAIIHAKANK